MAASGIRFDPRRDLCILDNIIHALHTEVKVTRRRHHLIYYDDCFIGSDIVDVVFFHLLHHNYYRNTRFSRTSVVQICQALLDCRVFDPVSSRSMFGRSKKQTVFEDSGLYRFPIAAGPNGYSSKFAYWRERVITWMSTVLIVRPEDVLDVKFCTGF